MVLTAPLRDIVDTRTFAQAIVDTVRDPLLVLDSDFRVVAVSRSFYAAFKVEEKDVYGRNFYALGNGEWDIPDLRTSLNSIIPEQAAMNGFEIDRDFPTIGRRVMLLNARKVVYDDSPVINLLVAFEDVTERRNIEHEKAELHSQLQELLLQKDMLLDEMQHRIANSLQIIASILMLKARSVTSAETRQHLEDAHQRVMSVAAVQSHLKPSGRMDEIEIGAYLAKLCQSLGVSMIGDDRPVVLQVNCDKGTALSATAVALGLLVTELVINALKHAFPASKTDCKIIVSYETNETDWRLTVSDNGGGRPRSANATVKTGLGTSLITALANQLRAQVETTSNSNGMSVSITHATFTSRRPEAA